MASKTCSLGHMYKYMYICIWHTSKGVFVFFLLRIAVQKSPRALVRCAGETWLPVGHKSCHMKAMNLAEAKGGWRLEALWPQPGHAVSKRHRRAVAATMFSAVYACTSHQSPLRCPQTFGVSPCSGATPTTDKLAAA